MNKLTRVKEKEWKENKQIESVNKVTRYLNKNSKHSYL